MNPLGTRARVEELARLLDGAVSGPQSLTVGHAALATRLRAVAPALDARLTPRSEFRAALRQRLLAVAAVQADAPLAAPLTRPKALDAAVTWSQTRRAQRRIGVTAGAMAGVVAFTGVGIAASRSLPGQPFYSLKRGAESVQLDLAHGDTAKGTKHLEFAATRLREVRALAHGDGELSLGLGSTTPQAAGGAFGRSLERKVLDTLSEFDSETTSGRDLLEKAYRATGKQEPLRILTSFSTQQGVRLRSILPDLPAGSQASAERSLTLLTDVGATADQLLELGTCSASCAPQSGGPTLPTEPVPTPGTTALPGTPSDDNSVPPCVCQGPTPGTTPAAQTEDGATSTPAAEEPSPATSTEPTPQSTPTPGLLPIPLPVPLPSLPVVLPTALTTLLPTALPTLPPLLPTAVPSLLPTLLSLIPTLAPKP
jgi:hypothetical protein